MPDARYVKSFLAGVLVANSAPHLATASAGRTHLTPVGGRDSGPLTNLAWGAANLVGGLLLVRRAAGGTGRWDGRLVAFDAGAAVFAAWMALSEGVLGLNVPPSARR